MAKALKPGPKPAKTVTRKQIKEDAPVHIETLQESENIYPSATETGHAGHADLGVMHWLGISNARSKKILNHFDYIKLSNSGYHQSVHQYTGRLYRRQPEIYFREYF